MNKKEKIPEGHEMVEEVPLMLRGCCIVVGVVISMFGILASTAIYWLFAMILSQKVIMWDQMKGIFGFFGGAGCVLTYFIIVWLENQLVPVRFLRHKEEWIE